MKNKTPEAYLLLALKAAIKASAVIMDIYAGDFEVVQKEDFSPVTIADKNADAIIRELLEPSGLYVLSEEEEPLPFEKRKDMEELWIVDPLDGTKEFIKRNGEFTVNIALVKNGRPVLGIITAPASHTIYWALEGKGSFVLYQAGWDMMPEEVILPSQKMQPSATPAIRIIGSRSHANMKTQQYVENIQQRFPSNKIITGGSSLKFCRLAQGQADLYPRFSPINEWDIAAGVAIVEQAGGHVLDASTRLPVKFNKPDLGQPPFIAYNGYLDPEEIF